MSRYQCFRTVDETVCWRLLAGNNRAVALGGRDHPDLRGALAEIALVREFVRRAGPGDARFSIERTTSSQWRWLLSGGATAVLMHGVGGRADAIARSAQNFARRVDVVLAVQRFHDAAIKGEIDPGLAVFEPGRRGRFVTPQRTAPSLARIGDVSRQYRVS